jgi:hypothetical protein
MKDEGWRMKVLDVITKFAHSQWFPLLADFVLVGIKI